VLTHDLGFGELIAAKGANLPSVIIFRLRNMQPDSVNHYLAKTLARYADELEQGAVISVNEGQFRIRLLPIDLKSYLAKRKSILSD
jgi:predicted nuclease of predicted toxin-antitoxin system